MHNWRTNDGWTDTSHSHFNVKISHNIPNQKHGMFINCSGWVHRGRCQSRTNHTTAEHLVETRADWRAQSAEIPFSFSLITLASNSRLYLSRQVFGGLTKHKGQLQKAGPLHSTRICLCSVGDMCTSFFCEEILFMIKRIQ